MWGQRSRRPIGRPCGAAGPTTSGRMDKYTADAGDGVRGLIGKGEEIPGGD
ncbi:MAG: fumarate hydratase C-terminal domain-containing protein [Syntrophaceticus schinkii]